MAKVRFKKLDENVLKLRFQVIGVDKASKKIDSLTKKIEKAIQKYEKLLKLGRQGIGIGVVNVVDSKSFLECLNDPKNQEAIKKIIKMDIVNNGRLRIK
jgi:hypothetical protein